MTRVSLRELRKSFGAVRALDNISLEVSSCELLVLLGPSGCGKTSLLRCIAGREQPDGGRVLFDGRDVTAVPTAHRHIGMVFQSYALFPNMTLRDNIAFPLRMRQWSPGAMRTRVDEMLELVHLEAQAQRYPNQVSGGQQQRAALARALAPSPQVLLLDEPLSALDALVRTRLRDEIRRVQQAVGTTTVYVTHDQSEAMAIADRVVVMNQGSLEQVAPPSELYEAPATPFSARFVGSRNALDLPVRDGRVALGRAFDVPAPAGSNGLAVAFFRPEDVEICNANGGQPATVDFKIFLGSTTRVYLNVEGDGGAAQLHADLSSRAAAALEPGATIGVRIDSAHVRVFSNGAE